MTTAQALENVLNAWVNGRKVRDGIPLTIRQQAEQALLTADAQATVEALRRERDEYARMWRDGCNGRGEAHKEIEELTGALETETEVGAVENGVDSAGRSARKDENRDAVWGKIKK